MDVIRDRAMAENISALLDLHGPDSKAVVWAHNSHIQLQSGGPFKDTAPTMGQHLRERFGEEYVAFGFAFGHGSFGALDEALRMREYSVPSVPGTLDAALGDAGPPVFALDLRTVPTEVADWFATAPASRHIGGGYYPDNDETFWTRIDIRALFDALLFIRETSAARLHPTASYMFEAVREDPAAPNELVNLDFNAGAAGWRMPPQPSVGAYQVRVVHHNGSCALEIFRSESFWPWDSYRLLQTVLAAPWRGRRVTVRCPVSIETAHHASSAQLAVRVLKRGVPPKSFDRSSGWYERMIWQRVATREAQTQDLSLTTEVGAAAETFELALVMTGDGRARFGPITIEASH